MGSQREAAGQVPQQTSRPPHRRIRYGQAVHHHNILEARLLQLNLLEQLLQHRHAVGEHPASEKGRGTQRCPEQRIVGKVYLLLDDGSFGFPPASTRPPREPCTHSLPADEPANVPLSTRHSRSDSLANAWCSKGVEASRDSGKASKAAAPAAPPNTHTHATPPPSLPTWQTCGARWRWKLGAAPASGPAPAPPAHRCMGEYREFPLLHYATAGSQVHPQFLGPLQCCLLRRRKFTTMPLYAMAGASFHIATACVRQKLPHAPLTHHPATCLAVHGPKLQYLHQQKPPETAHPPTLQPSNPPWLQDPYLRWRPGPWVHQTASLAAADTPGFCNRIKGTHGQLHAESVLLWCHAAPSNFRVVRLHGPAQQAATNKPCTRFTTSSSGPHPPSRPGEEQVVHKELAQNKTKDEKEKHEPASGGPGRGGTAAAGSTCCRPGGGGERRQNWDAGDHGCT